MPTTEFEPPPIMIVDDDENHVLLLARRLKAAGVRNQLLHLRSGGEAFMYLKRFCPPAEADTRMPQVMFLDVNMPGLSGFDVLAWARQQSALAELKIVMVSAASEEWDAQIAAKLGANDYMLKFPTPEALAEKIADLIGQRPTVKTTDRLTADER